MERRYSFLSDMPLQYASGWGETWITGTLIRKIFLNSATPLFVLNSLWELLLCQDLDGIEGPFYFYFTDRHCAS